MPNKELTAKVKLNITDVDQKLRTLEARIKKIQDTISGAGSKSGLDTKLIKSATQAEKLNQATARTQLLQQKVATETAKTATQQERLTQAQMRTQQQQDRINAKSQKAEESVRKQKTQAEKVNREWRKTHPLLTKIADKLKLSTKETKNFGQAISDWNSKLNKSNPILNGIWGIVKKIGTTLLSLGTIKLTIQGADELTGIKNRLNNIAVNTLGKDKAYTYDSNDNIIGYSDATTDFTKDAMDKMYAVAQGARTSYSSLMQNVSKTMTLAPEAFQNNIDYAIRFQEIMSKSYAVAGASATEMETSMYQLTQALSSGVLQGDELRSVREGAPLAYQEIEKFAQGVLGTSESLTDLAADGKITSEMVVAAVMNMGNTIDQQFAMTEYRFADVWTQIKNSAQKAFTPVVEMFTEVLNDLVESGLVQDIEKIFTNISKFAMIALKAIQIGINWIKDNWPMVQNIVVAGLLLMITWTIIKAGIGIAAAYLEWKANVIAAYGSMKAWWEANLTMLKTVGVVAVILLAFMALIYVVYLWKNGTIDACQAITYALIIIAVAIFLIGVITGSVAMFVIAIIFAVLAVAFMFFEEVMGGIFVVGAFFKNVALSIANFFIAVWNWIGAAFHNMVAGIKNVATALLNVIKAVATNIGVAFNNAWFGAQSAFWNFIADCLDGLKKLEPAINAIAEVFGKEGFTLSGLVDSVRGKATSAESKMKDYVDVSDAWNSGMNTYQYEDASAAWQNGMNTYDTWQDGWANAAYNNGKQWGEDVKNSINEWGSQFQNEKEVTKTGEEGNWLDDTGKKLGLDFDDKFNFPAEEAVGKDYNPDYDKLTNGVGNIDDSTASMADSMELADEDLEYLRKVAEMEWKKEYTTRNIQIDMTNNNTINNENDLEGIITKLKDRLYEEAEYLPDGAYER